MHQIQLHDKTNHGACYQGSNDEQCIKQSTYISKPLQYTISRALDNHRVLAHLKCDRGKFVATIWISQAWVIEPSAWYRRGKFDCVELKLFLLSVLDQLNLILQLVLPDVNIDVVGAILVDLDIANDGLAANAHVTVFILLETFLVEVHQYVHRS